MVRITFFNRQPGFFTEKPQQKVQSGVRKDSLMKVEVEAEVDSNKAVITEIEVIL